MKCDQEMCPHWTGEGCACEVLGLSSGLHPCAGCGVELDGDDPNSRCEDCNESEGWASYAAEQERHAETTGRLELMTREARLSREATEKAVKRSERDALRSALASVRTHNGTPVTPKSLRWAATHEALCRSYIFDVLTALAGALDD